MTLEDARTLIQNIVVDLKRAGKPVLGASIGWELSRQHIKDLPREFGYEKLVDFLRDQCQPPLVIGQIPGSDVTIDLAESSGDDSSRVVKGAPPATSSALRRVEKIEPRVWWAVLSTRPSETYVHSSGRVLSGAQPGTLDEEWKRVERMPTEQQAQLLEDVAGLLDSSGVQNQEVREIVMAAAAHAASSDMPILEFSNTVSPLYRFSTAWHFRRVNAVLDYLLSSTGVNLRRLPGATTEGRSTTRAVRPTGDAGSSVRSAVPSAALPGRPADSGEELEGLRQIAKHAIDRMSVRELLDLRLPLESLRGLARRGFVAW